MSIEEIYSLFLNHPAICTDSRKVEKNGIFFSLKGDNFNGNAFAEIALENGCKYAIIDEADYYKDERYIVVENTLYTLQELAKHHRSNLKIPVIGITGTNGKTTTKELIKVVLEKKFNTLATSGNLNNHIGVPQTILRITDKTEMAIIEMGANHIGEISDLCEISQPDYGIITNIGKAHLEGFGSFEGIVKAKKELYDRIELNNGLLFVNKDNQLLSEMASRIKKITYGKSAPADHTGSITNTEPFIEIEWKNTATNKTFLIKSKLVGAYNFENIMAAVAIGNYFKIEASLIKEAIGAYTPSNNRSQIIKSNNNTIIMDAYNANPSSMEAAINNFASSQYEKKILILGDMFELGEYSETEHKRILELAISKKVYRIILAGTMFFNINKDKNIPTFKNADELATWLSINRISGATILVKGSRGVKMEKIIEAL